MQIHKTKTKRSDPKAAFTLVEVMVAAVILTIAGVGTVSALLQARKMTEGSIYVATAATIAQGYIEQIKNGQFKYLDEPTITELRSQGSEDELRTSPMIADVEVGNAATDIPNIRKIDFNNTPETDTDDLEINFVIYIDNITDETAGIADARRIIMRWSYLDNSRGTAMPVGNTLYAIRSEIPTF